MILKLAVFFLSGVLLRWGIIGFPSIQDIGSYWQASDVLFHTGPLAVMKEEFWLPFTAIQSQRLSFPEGLNLTQWPMTDMFHWTSMHLINLFSSTSTFAYNLYFILGAGLITASMGFLALSLGLSLPVALTAGLAYSSLPFGLERFHHIFFAIYLQVPMIFYVLLHFHRRISPRLLIFFGAIVGLTGVYFAFFSSALVGLFFLFVLVGHYSSLSKAGIKTPFMNSVYYMGSKLIFIILCMLPTWIYNYKYGDPGTNVRSPGESLIWALDIQNILLPPTSHWFAPYAGIRSLFFSWERLRFMSDYEGYAEYLGLPALIGLAICIYFTFSLLRRRKVTTNITYVALAFISLFCLAIALRYGLGYLFALTVSPQIRSWNRASLFIGTAGILAFFLFLQPYLDKHVPKKWTWAVCLSILLFCLAESGSIWRPMTPDLEKLLSDKNFSHDIKAIVVDKPVIGLPFGYFPDWRGYSSVEPYGNFRYLMYDTVHSIFPSVRGTAETNRKMQLFFGKFPSIDFLKSYGIAGVVIDKHDYADQGADAISAYSNSKVKTVQSKDGRFYFISLY